MVLGTLKRLFSIRESYDVKDLDQKKGEYYFSEKFGIENIENFRFP